MEGIVTAVEDVMIEFVPVWEEKSEGERTSRRMRETYQNVKAASLGPGKCAIGEILRRYIANGMV